MGRFAPPTDNSKGQVLETVTNLSIILGIWTVIYGVDAWRREHVGKRRIELAEETLALFYEAEDAIRNIRNPLSFGHETEDIDRGVNETDEQYTARKNASVVFVRYDQHKELFSKIHASRYRFMAQIGKEEARPFEELRAIVNDILHSARTLARYWARNRFHSQQRAEKHFEIVDKAESIFWEGSIEDDPINARLAKMICTIESECRSVIEGKGTLYGLLNRKIRAKKNRLQIN